MRPRSSLLLVVLIAIPLPAGAKPPTLATLFPPGARAGQSLEVTASGSFATWPVRVWVDGEGVAVEAGEREGTLNVTVEPDADPGVRWVRLFDGEGASELRPFVVGSLPEAVEAEPNDDPKAPQVVDPGLTAITLNGRLAKKGDVDGFAVTLARGQILVASMEANRSLGSPMDAILQVATPEGFVLADNDDDRGLDPRIVFEAPGDGSYIVRTFAFPATPDSTIGFAGGDAYLYRLTLSTAGTIDHAFPLAVARSEPGEVEVIGWDLPVARRRLAVPSSDVADTAIVRHPDLAGEAEVRLSDMPTLVEEPVGEGDFQALPIPSVLSGRIGSIREEDRYEFQAEAGRALTFRIESRSIGLPLDPVVRLTDLAGKVLAELDDTKKDADPVLKFKPPASATYRLGVRDLHGRGGPRFAYRLTAGPPSPDFRLDLAADRFTLEPGKPLDLKVKLRRIESFVAPIEVVAVELPEGLTVRSATSNLKEVGSNFEERSEDVTIVLEAQGLETWAGPIRIEGRASDGSEGTRVRRAEAPVGMAGALTDQPWLTVVPAPEESKAEAKPGG